MIDMHAHWRPAELIDALRARTKEPRIVFLRRKLESADALIATCCLYLAHEMKQEVVFYSHDWPLYLVLRDIEAFRSSLKLRYVGPSKDGTPTET